MDTLFFHPKVVHIPIALAVLMPLVSAALTLAWWRKWLPARAWAMAVALQVALLASGIVARLTGETEEDRVEHIVSESAIEAHEEAAEVFVWVSGAVLGVMLLALVTSRKRPGLPLAVVATVGTVAVLGLGYRTGQAGGALVYQHGAANAYVTPGGQAVPLPQQHADHDDDDDD